MKYKPGDKVRIKSLDWYNENKDATSYKENITEEEAEHIKAELRKKNYGREK